MQQYSLSNRTEGTSGATIAWRGASEALNVAVVYQDAPTRQWAEQARRRLAESAGKRAVCSTEWKLGDLRDAKIFSEGVAALARADVIVIALYDADRLPPPFYLWVNLWLQVRAGRPGTLVALVVQSPGTNEEANDTRRYFYAAASQGRLELVMQESPHPGEPIHVLSDDNAPWAKAA